MWNVTYVECFWIIGNGHYLKSVLGDLGSPKAVKKSMKWVTASSVVSLVKAQTWSEHPDRADDNSKSLYRSVPGCQSETVTHHVSLQYSTVRNQNQTDTRDFRDRAASSSFIHLHNAAKDSGLHRGGVALLTSPAAHLRPSGLVVKRPLEKNCGWNTLGCLCPVCWIGWIALTLALCQADSWKPLSKSHSSVQYIPNAAIPFCELFCKPHLSVLAITSLLRQEWFQCSWGFAHLPSRSD